MRSPSFPPRSVKSVTDENLPPLSPLRALSIAVPKEKKVLTDMPVQFFSLGYFIRYVLSFSKLRQGCGGCLRKSKRYPRDRAYFLFTHATSRVTSARNHMIFYRACANFAIQNVTSFFSAMRHFLLFGGSSFAFFCRKAIAQTTIPTISTTPTCSMDRTQKARVEKEKLP